MVYGHVGVGKSTFARHLADQSRAVRFDSDAWVGALYGRDEGSVADFAVAQVTVEAVMAGVWTRCLGVDVVLDLGFWTRSKRDQVRARVTEHGAVHRMYEIIAPVQVAWSRVDRRNVDPNSSLVISRSSFDAFRSRVEPLGADEPHEVVDTG